MGWVGSCPFILELLRNKNEQLITCCRLPLLYNWACHFTLWTAAVNELLSQSISVAFSQYCGRSSQWPITRSSVSNTKFVWPVASSVPSKQIGKINRGRTVSDALFCFFLPRQSWHLDELILSFYFLHYAPLSFLFPHHENFRISSTSRFVWTVIRLLWLVTSLMQLVLFSPNTLYA